MNLIDFIAIVHAVLYDRLDMYVCTIILGIGSETSYDPVGPSVGLL